MERQILRKAYSSEPTYGTYWDTKRYSEIPRINIFPYPFYFVSDPFDENPSVHNRRAGWSPEVNVQRKPLKGDIYPSHCFQNACNSTDTKELKENGCTSKKCINLER